MADTADARKPQRSLWLQVLWKPEFRSTREKVVYYSVSYVLVFLILFLATYVEWLGTVLFAAVFVPGVLILHAAVLVTWMAWGRKRFPLPSPDESPDS